MTSEDLLYKYAINGIPGAFLHKKNSIAIIMYL